MDQLWTWLNPNFQIVSEKKKTFYTKSEIKPAIIFQTTLKNSKWFYSA